MNTRKLRKAILTLCSALLLVSLSVGATLAYLTSQDSVVNTFTVGNVKINLDEADVNEMGEYETTHDSRVEANEYKFYPNHVYKKDPTVTVLKGSDEAYVRAFVTVNMIDKLDVIFANDRYDLEKDILNGTLSDQWIPYGYTDDTTNMTRTYELRYATIVSAPTADVVLEDIFTEVKVPSDITKEELATLVEYKTQQAKNEDGTDKVDENGNPVMEPVLDAEGNPVVERQLTISVIAQAIQADGFVATIAEDGTVTSAEDNAWNAWSAREDDNI